MDSRVCDLRTREGWYMGQDVDDQCQVEGAILGRRGNEGRNQMSCKSNKRGFKERDED